MQKITKKWSTSKKLGGTDVQIFWEAVQTKNGHFEIGYRVGKNINVVESGMSFNREGFIQACNKYSPLPQY